MKITALLLLIIFILGGCGTPAKKPEPALSAEHRSEIEAALQAKGFPIPSSLEIESGWLVATFILYDPRSAAYLESFATDSLLVIRNTTRPHGIVRNYRVTLDGPPPGPDLVLRYGSARFIEGGKLVWEPARK